MGSELETGVRGICRRRKIRKHLIFAVVVSLGALLITWLILGETSPFDEYFRWHVGIPNFWRALNAVPFIAGSVISGSHAGPHPAIFITLQFIQWFIIGYVLSTVLSRVFRKA